jgi:2-oxoglutarate ferredoxin oxidoreductase subunit alpha
LYPYPYNRINELADHVKGILTVELNAGQMIEDVRLGVNGKIPVEHYGRMGGIIPSPEEVEENLGKCIKKW